jgi:transketolase
MPLEPLGVKIRSFGWNVIETDGNNIEALIIAFQKAGEHRGAPSAIIANTIPGKGVSFMENKYEWHGKPPTREQAEIALAELRGEESSLKGKLCEGCGRSIEECDCMEGE